MRILQAVCPGQRRADRQRSLQLGIETLRSLIFATEPPALGGRHIQPTQAEIEARLNTPACRAVFGDSDQGVDQSTAVQRELSRIDQEIEQQRKGLANSSTPGTN